MNKPELSRIVAKDMEGIITKKIAADVVDNVFDTIAAALAGGEKISIAGFGIFETHQRAARSAKSPVTGETIETPTKTVPVFRPGKKLKERVAGKQE